MGNFERTEREHPLTTLYRQIETTQAINYRELLRATPAASRWMKEKNRDRQDAALVQAGQFSSQRESWEKLQCDPIYQNLRNAYEHFHDPLHKAKAYTILHMYRSQVYIQPHGFRQ